MLKWLTEKIEAHRTKSTAHKWLPKPCGKGVGAEVGIVADALLAVRKISALLSRFLCGELSKSSNKRLLKIARYTGYLF